MKLFALVLALSCVIAYATAGKRGHYWPTKSGISFPHRFRREVGLQDSIAANVENDQDAQVSDDISPPGSDIQDVSRQKREAMEESVRLELEKQFGRNAFATGFTELQRGPGGRVEPIVGATAGMRFRRAAEPQRNTINFQGTQPLSGPDRRPTWDLNYNRNLLNNGRTTADLYGGLSKVPGQRVQPHIGIQAERNFGRNGFLRGSGQLQPGPGGRGLSPSVGITGGFRFRREAEDVDDTELIEEH